MGGEASPSSQNAARDTNKSWWFLFRALPRMCRQASREWISDDAPRLGAAVAFYSLPSLAPILVIAIAAAAVFYGQEAAAGRLVAEARGVAGPEVARTIREMIHGAYQPRIGVLATLLGLATLAFGASSVFVELRDAMNTIWHVSIRPCRSNAAAVFRLIRDRFYSFATLLGAGFLLLVSLVLNSWIAAIWGSVPRVARWTILYLLVAALFAALYRIVPDVALQWRDVALGAAITSLLFMIGKEFMALYFAHAGFASLYSAAGSPMVVLLWVYYSAQLFFWGAEFTKVYAQTLGPHQVVCGI